MLFDNLQFILKRILPVRTGPSGPIIKEEDYERTRIAHTGSKSFAGSAAL